MLYKAYIVSSVIILSLFGMAQYYGWSPFSENAGQHFGHTHSSGGSYGGGSHRGSYHK